MKIKHTSWGNRRLKRKVMHLVNTLNASGRFSILMNACYSGGNFRLSFNLKLEDGSYGDVIHTHEFRYLEDLFKCLHDILESISYIKLQTIKGFQKGGDLNETNNI